LQVEGLNDLKASIAKAYDDYVKELNGNLENITQAVTDATGTVVSGLGAVEDAIKRILGSYGVQGLDTDTIGYTRQYAAGTKYHPGGPARVNEKGLEIVNLPDGSVLIPQLPRGSSVINANMTKSLMSMTSGLNAINTRMPKVDVTPSNSNNLNQEITLQPTFVINGVTNPEDIQKYIDSHAKDLANMVSQQITKNVNKVGNKKSWY